MNLRRLLPLLSLCLSTVAVLADGPADNQAEKVRPVPPPGIAVAPADRAELEAGLAALAKEIEGLEAALKEYPDVRDLAPDVEIYYKAVHDALAYNEFYRTNEIEVAKGLLQQGTERAQALKAGQAPWGDATGLIVRAYRSKI